MTKEYKFKVGDIVTPNCSTSYIEDGEFRACNGYSTRCDWKIKVLNINYHVGTFQLEHKPDRFRFISEWDLVEPEPVYPIKIETTDGYITMADNGFITIYDHHARSSCIRGCELEQFQDIIKQAIEVRDKKNA